MRWFNKSCSPLAFTLVEDLNCYYMSLSFEGVLVGAAAVTVGLGNLTPKDRHFLGPFSSPVKWKVLEREA